jgi:hypothetical protein
MNAEALVVIALVVVFLAAGSLAVNRISQQPSRRPSTYSSYARAVATSLSLNVMKRRLNTPPWCRSSATSALRAAGATRSREPSMPDGSPPSSTRTPSRVEDTAGGEESRHAVVRWDLPGAGLPNFNVLPADFFDLTPGVGKAPASTMTVPSDPAFSQAFIAVGEPASLERLLSPELRAAMIERSDNHLAGSEDVLFWWLDVPLPGADGVDGFLEMAARVSRLVSTAGGSAPSA